jgi:serine/threonine-protein kinase
VGSSDLRQQLQRTLGDHCTLERELGGGGMSRVFVAQETQLGRSIVVKVLLPDLAAGVSVDRFRREILLVAKLQHPHIVPLLSAGVAEGLPFYTMPLVEGEPLRARLSREHELPIDEVIRILRDITGALSYAHEHGIVHRDIKPENVLLTKHHALVTDFGVAKAIAVSTRSDGSKDAPDLATSIGVALGTPAYMSPEQAAADPQVDSRSDLYSLGAVAYEMLAGQPLFAARSAQAMLAAHAAETPVPVTTRRPSIPEALAELVMQCVQKHPADRPKSAEMILQTLEAVASGSARARTAKGATSEKSVAVLAFENMSADPENEYFSDGIAEDIINALAQLDGLRVAARASAFSFKGKKEDLRVIGEKLSVTTVLHGSVRKAGTRLRITAQLINVADGYQLWSERYDRELTDVFAVQDEIAEAIAAKLRVTFAKPVEDRAVRPMTTHLEAYELCVQGRALLLQRGGGILRALPCFERAIALDPDYAPAHAGLGETLRVQSMYGYAHPAQTIPRAKAAIERALELEANLADAVATLGLIALTYDRDLATGSDAVARALALNPLLGLARGMYAMWTQSLSRDADEQAIAEASRAAGDDPLNAIVGVCRAVVLGVAGRHSEAIAEADRAAALDPNSFVAQLVSAWTRHWGSDPEGALRAIRPALQMSGRNPWALGFLTGIYAAAGD